MPDRTLYQFTLSPYCIKVRRVLEYKRLPYVTVEVNPFSRGEVGRISGQKRVPVLVETGERGAVTVVPDSTAIAAHLDAACPDPPVYPRSGVERARVAMLEDWADEQFARNLIPFKILTGGNARLMVGQSKAFYPKRWSYEILFPFGPAYLRAVASRLRRRRSLARLRADYERDLDMLDALASSGSFLAGEQPTVFDFAVWGFLRTMEGLEGQELLAPRESLSAWYALIAKL